MRCTLLRCPYVGFSMSSRQALREKPADWDDEVDGAWEAPKVSEKIEPLA